MQFAIEGLEGKRVPVLFGVEAAAVVQDVTAPKNVVDQQEAARPQQGESLLIVGVVAALVGVYDKPVEGAARAFGEEQIQRLASRRKPQLDAFGNPGSFPIISSDGRPLVADVAADQLAIG